jgi:NADH:ubiquinone oxidoreductase subunit E
MPTNSEPVEIVVCLGSSCFARGNSEHLATIKAYIEAHNLNATVRLAGRLCQDFCKQGPNISIRGELQHQVTPAALRTLLQQLGGATRDGNGAD